VKTAKKELNKSNMAETQFRSNRQYGLKAFASILSYGIF